MHARPGANSLVESVPFLLTIDGLAIVSRNAETKDKYEIKTISDETRVAFSFVTLSIRAGGNGIFLHLELQVAGERDFGQFQIEIIVVLSAG